MPASLVSTLPVCGCGCGKALPRPAGRGRRRRYFDDECKARARRLRESSALRVWASIGAELATVPPDPLSQRNATLAAVAELIEGRAAAPAEDQLVQALLEARQLAFGLRRIAGQVAPALQARAFGLADDLTAAISRHFKELESA